ncbi:hypothetical protein GF319_05755 [Candidatus Bathyarchaeota archaeon]|nr:hypothetical protein [Candidatus Bathyarchaeota archaeon]
MPESKSKVGEITHFFTDINVAVIELTDTLEEGDRIKVEGATTDFEHTVRSMEIEHEHVEIAEAGQSIGLKIPQRAREGDTVYKING